MRIQSFHSRLARLLAALWVVVTIITLMVACTPQPTPEWVTPEPTDSTPTGFVQTMAPEASPVVSATPDYQATEESRIYDPQGWTKYPVASDLIQDELEFIAEAPNGNLWFGAGRGVVRFDGEIWTAYTYKDLGNTNVSALAVAPDGTVWLGTDQNGILSFDGQDWMQFTTTDGLPGNEITAIEVSQLGELWVASRTGISKFDGQRWFSYPMPNIAADDYIQDIAITTDGAIWFGSNLGMLIRFYDAQWTTEELAGYIRCMTTTPDGALWVVAGYPRRGSQIFKIAQEKMIFSNQIFEIYPPLTISTARDGTVWVGTVDGYQAAYYDGSTWRSLSGKDIFSTEYSSYEDRLPPGWIFCMMEAHDGALWFGTAAGAYRYAPSK